MSHEVCKAVRELEKECQSLSDIIKTYETRLSVKRVKLARINLKRKKH
jgi:hypothetical protein